MVVWHDALTIDGQRIQYNPKRSLTAKEQELRNINALWGDVPDQGQLGKYGG